MDPVYSILSCLLSKFVKVQGTLPKSQAASSLAHFVHLQSNLVLFSELSEQGNWVPPRGRQRTQQYQRPKVGP